MNGPATDMSALLATAGIGTEGTDLFINKAPEDIAIAGYAIASLNDTGGFDPLVNADTRQYEPTWQVLVIGPVDDFAAGETYMHQIRNELIKATTFTAAPYLYYGNYQQGDIQAAGYDENNRPLFTSNYRAFRQETTP